MGAPLSPVGSVCDPCAEALQRTWVRLPAQVPLLRVTPPLLPGFLSHSSAILSIKPEKAKKIRHVIHIYIHLFVQDQIPGGAQAGEAAEVAALMFWWSCLVEVSFLLCQQVAQTGCQESTFPPEHCELETSKNRYAKTINAELALYIYPIKLFGRGLTRLIYILKY